MEVFKLMLEDFAAHAQHIAEAIIDTDTTKYATIINTNRLASPRLCRAKRYIGHVLTHIQASTGFHAGNVVQINPRSAVTDLRPVIVVARMQTVNEISRFTVEKDYQHGRSPAAHRRKNPSNPRGQGPLAPVQVEEKNLSPLLSFPPAPRRSTAPPAQNQPPNMSEPFCYSFFELGGALRSASFSRCSTPYEAV